MSIFGRKKIKQIDYDPATKQPAIRSSICTGEKVAGFVDIQTKHFQDYMLIKSNADLQEFCEGCGISEADLKKIT